MLKLVLVAMVAVVLAERRGGKKAPAVSPGLSSSCYIPLFVITLPLSQILTREPRVHQIQNPATAAAGAAASPGWTGTTSPTTAARTLTGTITGPCR